MVSLDSFNRGPAGLIVVLPMTTSYRGIPLHIEVIPPDGGVRLRSFIKCEDIRSISSERLIERWGSLSHGVMEQVEDRLRILLQL